MTTTYTRQNAWDNNGTFDNPDLLAYAVGVGQMMARPLNDKLSWWSFAAIHGEYVGDQGFPGWGFLPGPPNVPTTPVPSPSDQGTFWDQCQHQSWYFAPWHRGYLAALEAQVRAEIVQLGGPPTWALPYWNYFGLGNELNMPPAFAQPTLPNQLPSWVPQRYAGAANPLFVTARYGPDGDGNIYIPTPAGAAQHPQDPNFGFGIVSDVCLSNTVYTGSNEQTSLPGFGGPDTGFSHGGGTSGNLEQNPHNLVHVYVGGAPKGNNEIGGLMSDPGIAALDPIFYLHHSNIDRMWAVWNQTLGNANPTDEGWLSGPAAQGQREFVMPYADGSSRVYTPAQMVSLSQMNYTYTDLTAPPAAPRTAASRLRRLGATAAAARVNEGANVSMGKNRELMGANTQPVSVVGSGARTVVRLDPKVRGKVAASLASASETQFPDHVYLNLENVRGVRDAHVLSVYINLPEGGRPGDHPELLAGSVALFGLRRASRKDGEHAGQGLSFTLDITDIVDALHLGKQLNADSLHVTIVPNRAVPEQAEITIGRVSVYRQGQ